MSNSIRTPRQGITANSKRIAEAVDNEEWQEFRLSLKGQPTKDKLAELKRYRRNNCPHANVDYACDYCIRVDNYIKALCRGGQLEPGESLQMMINEGWRPHIRK